MKKKLFGVLTRIISSNVRTEDTIIVSGSPRSGTTWLAELFRELHGYKLINEPLRLSTNPRARQAGFEWRTHVGPDDNRPELRAHLANILRGRVELGPAWHFRKEHIVHKCFEHVTCRKPVVKFCRAGRMLHWLANQFKLRGLVVIIRHPCAVIASQLKMGDNWAPENIQHIPITSRFGGQIPDSFSDKFSDVLKDTDRWVEHLAIQWALDYRFAFYEHADPARDHPWMLTTYEKLLTDGLLELERLLDGMGGNLTDSMCQQFEQASAFASDDLRFNHHYQLTKWRSELSGEQTNAILQVVNALGIDFYSSNPLPDYERLAQFNGCYSDK